LLLFLGLLRLCRESTLHTAVGWTGRTASFWCHRSALDEMPQALPQNGAIATCIALGATAQHEFILLR
jgi:hypothetical protein